MEDVIFWELGGYKKILEGLQQGQRSCELFMKMVQERADIEERYARSLENWRERWVQSVTHGREVGGTVKAWCVCLEEATTLSRVHRACVERLTGGNGPIVNMMGWVDEHYKRSDNNGYHLIQRLEEQFQLASEEFKNEYTRAVRAKEAYHTLSKEAQKARRFAEAEEQETKVNDTTKTRLFSRADKLTIRENYVRRIYRRRIAGCKGEVKDRYREQMEGVLARCREIESARLQCLQNQMLAFISFLDMTSSSDSLLEECRNRYKKVSTSNSSLDVQEWLLRFHLDKFIELPTFEEYNLDDEDYDLLGKTKVPIDKTKRPTGSFFQLSLFGSSSEDESSASSESSSSSTSSESGSSSASSESENEISIHTSVSSLPRSSPRHQYDTLSHTTGTPKEPEYLSNTRSIGDEQQESVLTDGTIPHSTSSSGFPISQENVNSSPKHNEGNQTASQYENAFPKSQPREGSLSTKHHVNDVPHKPSMEVTEGKSINLGSELTTHNNEIYPTQSKNLSVENLPNVAEINTLEYYNSTIIESHVKRTPGSENTKCSTSSVNNHSYTNKPPGYDKTSKDVSNSTDLRYEVQDALTEPRSLVGPYFINKNFRWASVSPPIAAKETRQHPTETCEVQLKDEHNSRDTTPDDSRSGTDSPKAKPTCPDRIAQTNNGPGEAEGRSHSRSETTNEILYNGTSNVGQGSEENQSNRDVYNSENGLSSKVKISDKNNSDRMPTSQRIYECQMGHMHYQATDRPIKECLVRWFLGKYPEYWQYEEGMWKFLQGTNPRRYRAAIIDAKRLMIAVGARSMICSSSDKPRALHLCNSLHRCRECVDDYTPCPCPHEGQRPILREHQNVGRSESDDFGSDLSHFENNQTKRPRQDLEFNEVYQETVSQILHIHGRVSESNHSRPINPEKLHDPGGICNSVADHNLYHGCDERPGRATSKSTGESSTSRHQSSQFQAQNKFHYQEQGYIGPIAESEKQPSPSLSRNSEPFQESDFSSDQSNSTSPCPSCDLVGGNYEDLSGGNRLIFKERSDREKQAREILRPTEDEFLVRVLYDFRPANRDELRLRAGEYLVQIGRDNDNGWATGRNRTKRGIFPASYVHFVRS